MKNRNILLAFLICTSAVLGSGCEDRRMNNMMEDNVYLSNSGINVQKIFKWENFIYQLQVVKSGTGQQGGEVMLQVDESALESYGTKYTLLPAQYYKIKKAVLSLEKTDYQLPFEIEFDAPGIEVLQTTTKLVYAVPFKLTSESFKLAAGSQLSSLVVPTVINPYLGFKTPGLAPAISSISSANSPAETKFYAFVQTNYHNKTDLNYKVVVDEAILTAYNIEKKTSHKLLPAEAYRIDEASFGVKPLNNEQALAYFLIKDKIPKGSYMLPLKLTEVSQHGINPEESSMLIPVSIQD